MKFAAQQFFGPSGLLAQNLDSFEYRPEQQQMADHVAQALDGQRHAVIEAGTGVGKSLAYLIPALCFAAEHKKRVIVATHTINLQEQLFNKDIPLLQRILPFEFRALLFKGRRNYLCRRRFWLFWEEEQLAKASEPAFQRLREWQEETSTGERNTCPLGSSPAVWNSICCEKESCPEEECPYFYECFYWQLRHQLSKAQLIIVNQALLLADRSVDGSVLPHCDAVIIDEAHNLEDASTGAFSLQLNMGTLLGYYRTGLHLINSLQGEADPAELAQLRRLLESILTEGSTYLARVGSLVETPPQIIDDALRRHLGQTELPQLLDKLRRELPEVETAETEAETLLAKFADFTRQTAENMRLILTAQDQRYVFWLELKEGAASLEAAPIDVSNLLAENLFSSTDSVILCSATLTTDRGFGYFRARVGLEEADELQLGSPFDYAQQAVLCIPSLARHPQDGKYLHYTAYLIMHTLALAKGGVLALFTSYQTMEQVAELMAAKLDEVGYTMFIQGEDDRSRLVEQFSSTPQAILLGTNSFWEGVDIPGEALRAVVITRLPFTVPDRPVTAARLRRVEELGGSPFADYSVPQAILRLKQGFGRLIRTCSDRGAVVIVDARIVSAPYGRRFLDSLPPARFTRRLDDLKELWPGIRNGQT